MDGKREAGGTLARLIPLDRIDGRVVKWRVEVGDLGDSIGSVMKAVGRDEYEAYLFERGSTAPMRSGRHFAMPEAAALSMAAAYWMSDDDPRAEPVPEPQSLRAPGALRVVR